LGSIILFGSYAKKSYQDDSDIDLLYIGTENIQNLRKIGRVYGKTVNVKQSTPDNFDKGLKNKDIFIREILKHHIVIQNPEWFVNSLWKVKSDGA